MLATAYLYDKKEDRDEMKKNINGLSDEELEKFTDILDPEFEVNLLNLGRRRWRW